MKKRNSIINRVEDEVRASKQFEDEARVIAGVSGGADSVALLHALTRCGIDTTAIHCNFHLRGEESERDRRFVERLCARLGVGLHVVNFDVEAYRREHKGTSTEMACRELRYAEFRRIMEEEKAKRIAIAHNSDDNAETLLLNLLRGSGVSGLRAMLPDNGEIWRPLLSVSRAEIEEYLDAIRREKEDDDELYIIDSTNLESDYSRNFLRNEVIPLIETRWHAAKSALNRTARIMAEEERMLERLERGNGDIDRIGERDSILPLCDMDAEMRRWKTRRFAMRHGAGSELAMQIAESVSENPASAGRRWQTAEGEFTVSTHGLEYLHGAAPPEGMDISGEFRITEHPNTPELIAAIKSDRSNRTLWIPKEAGDIRLRTRRRGDRMRPLGMKGSRLVSDIVSDAHLAASEKRRIAVAEQAQTGEILWVEGLKRSRESLISPENKIILEIVRKI